MLPAKASISIHEATDRWQTDTDHILDLFRQGHIIPAYHFLELCVDIYQGNTPTGDPDGTLSFDGDHIESNLQYTEGVLYVYSYAWQKKMHDNQDRLCINLKDAWLTESPRGEILKWLRPDRDQHDQLIPIESLVITRHEVDHLEKPAPVIEPKQVLGNMEKDNLLRAIGLLARAFVEKGGTKYGSPDKPTVDAIVGDLLTHLEHHNEDNTKDKLSDQGLSKANLHKRITEGLQKLKF